MNSRPATDACIVCHGSFSPYPIGDKDGYRFVSCRSCGSVLADPWPTDEALEKYYGDIQPEAVHAQNPQAEIDTAAKILGKTLPQPAAGKNRLLDINAQRGYAVVAAQKLGWKATGLNAQEFLHRFAVANYGEQNFIHSDVISYAAQSGEKYDVIITASAFTEARDLDAFTTALTTLLAPGGVIFIEEPDGNHFNTPRDFAGWAMVEPPVTCATLSKKGLTKLLARHGLGFKKIFFTWLRPFVRGLAAPVAKKK